MKIRQVETFWAYDVLPQFAVNEFLKKIGESVIEVVYLNPVANTNRGSDYAIKYAAVVHYTKDIEI